MIKLTDNIFYVGVKDNIGTSYNAYLVSGEKNILIETVHGDYVDLYINQIAEIIPLEKIDCLICTTTGTEYTKSILKIIELNPDIEIIGTIAAIKNLKEMTNTTFNEHIAKNGAELDFGNGNTLKFIITPNLPWTDTMVVYAKMDKTLFCGHLFSAHYCESGIYDCDIVNNQKYEEHKKSFYDKVLSPFGAFVHSALEKLALLDIKIICTLNGPVIKNGITENISNYSDWCKAKSSETKTAAVFCPFSHTNTCAMAVFAVKTFIEFGVNAILYDAEKITPEVVEALNTADVLVFGTPTINKNAAKEMWQLIAELDAVNAKGRLYFVLGSYGWSGEGIQLIHNHLKLLKLKPFDKPFGTLFTPSQNDFNNIYEYICRIAGEVKNIYD